MTTSKRNGKQIAKVVKAPHPMDVLLGRGKSYRRHPGNIVFQGK
jgi:hypothetical protein